MKAFLGYPDAYGDLLEWSRLSIPAAILDVGAHVGETVTRFLDESTIPIHAFEPTPESYQLLSQRFESNPQVSVHQVALAATRGEQVLFLNENPQTNSLLDNAKREDLPFAQHTRHVGQVRVATRTLDDWADEFLPVGELVVKADVQGSEGELIAGGRNVLRERVSAFYSEAQISRIYSGQLDFSAIHQVLTGELGFVLVNIYPCLLDELGRAVQTDALWVKEDRLLELRRR